MSLNVINGEILKKKEKRKVNKNGLGKNLTLGALAVAIVLSLTGCGGEKKDVEVTPEPTTTIESSVSDQDQIIADLMDRLEALENEKNGINVGVDDTYSQADWDKFVIDAKKVVDGKINNVNDRAFEIALTVLNIDYLDANGKQILLDLYDSGQDVESILNQAYSLLSQIREYNTELGKEEDYLSYDKIIIAENDKAIVATLEEYALEVYVLRQDLTKDNKARIQEIFDMILAFSNGTGTIEVSVGGEIKDIAQINLSNGGIFTAENIAQQISVMSKDIVSQDLREKLDDSLRSKDNLSNVQTKIVQYTTIATLDGINLEEQAKVVSQYTQGLEIIEAELAVMGISKEETKAIYTVYNIDYFMDSLESQNAFAVIYKDGFSINETFTLAESAIEKIVIYNAKQDSVDKIYDLARLAMNSEVDAISLRALSQTIYNVGSSDAEIAAQAALIVKNYNAYSSETTVNYQTRDEDGILTDHSLDKNALSLGGRQTANWLSYYSMTIHKSVYDKHMDTDAVIKFVDGSATGLDPYESIVFMVDDYCAANNVVVYDYEMGAIK
jgi:hypothetical protein